MKQTLLSLALGGLCALGVSVSSLADSPVYKTAASSVAGASATVFFASDSVSQIRVVNAIEASDLATSTLGFVLTTTPYAITVANTNTSSTNIIVGGYVGLLTNSYLLYQDAARTTNFFIGVTNLVGGTNIQTCSALPANVAQKVGDEVYLVSLTNTIFVGKGSNVTFSGEAVQVANRGRPLAVIQTGTSWSSTSTSVHYDN